MSANILQLTQDDGADYEAWFEGKVGDAVVENDTIATFLTEKPIEDQCSAAKTLFEAIKDKALADLFILNDVEAASLRMAALISMPNSGTVGLVYGLEVGLDSIVAKKLTAKKILALLGEGSHEGAPPAGIMLESSAVKVQAQVKSISDKAVDVLTAGIQQSQADGEVEVMQIAPIQAYLGIDALEEAVPAGKILERLGKHHDADKDYIKHLKDFLMASIVIHNKKEPKTELEQNTFFNCLGDTHLRVWSQKHFATLIKPPVAPVPVPPPAAPAQASGPKESKQKWSNRKVKYFVLLCGKEPSDSRQANLDQLPGWFQDIAEELDTFQQLSIIRELLKENRKYPIDTANNPDLLD